MTETPRETSNSEVLEQDVRLSESLLWRLQEDYFAKNGVSSWDAVPFYPTSSVYVCDAYADMVLAFLLDYAPYLDRKAPVWFLELGTGTGSFSFHFLRALRAKRAGFHALSDLDIRYVMTDFTTSIVDAWQENPFLKPWVDAKILDFAVFHPEVEDSLQLRVSQQSLSSRDVRNPLVTFANYFFDTIRQDVFQVKQGALHETLLTFSRDSRRFPPGTAVSIEQIECGESHVPVEPEGYYDEPLWNRILEDYRRQLDPGSLIIPIGALRTIRNLKHLADGRLALFAMDRGFTDPFVMKAHGSHPYACHGSFSFNVNFDAIQRYFELMNGQTLLDDGLGFDLSVSMNVLLPEYPSFEQTRYFFKETLSKKDPINSLYYIQTFLSSIPRDTKDSKWVKPLLSMMQLCVGEPVVFAHCAQLLEQLVENMDVKGRLDLKEMLSRVRENMYSLNRKREILEPMLRLLYQLGCLHECLEVCSEHRDLFGPTPWVLGYMALCHKALGRRDLASQCIQQFRMLEPDNSWAREFSA